MENAAYCLVSCSPVRIDKSDRSEIVTQLLFGELVQIREIEAPWVHITTLFDSYEGYVDHKHLKRLSGKEAKRWLDGITLLTNQTLLIDGPQGKQTIYQGSYIQELKEFNIGKDTFTILEDLDDDFDSPSEAAMSYLNSPYLWGGKSPFGIDCSGFTQLVFRNFGVNLPRDAYEQADVGMGVEYGEIQPEDLAFFANSSGKITHVGLVLENTQIIHASGHVRIDQLTADGIINSQTGELTHNLAHIKRIR